MIDDRSTPVIQARGLTKTYPGAHALRGVDLDIARGSSVAIMGPSGSGKSTLLHVIAGLVTPNAGTVRFHDPAGDMTEITTLKRAGRARLRREAFGFVFQQGLLMPELTAVENIAVGGMMAGLSRSRSMAAALQWLDRLGLSSHAQHRIGQLSGGQAQRVAVARSQIADPPITFADEPTGALDSVTSDEVMSVLLAATSGRGRTLVIVTHDARVAARAERIVTVHDGLLGPAPSPAGSVAPGVSR